MKQVFCWLLAVNLITISGIAHADYGASIAPAHEQELLHYSFSAQILDCTISTFQMPQILPNDASQDRRYLITPLTTPAGSLWIFSSTVASLALYHAHFGILPNNGMALFEELTTEALYTVFMEMTPAERFERYKEGINRHTGMFTRPSMLAGRQMESISSRSNYSRTRL